MKVKHPRGSMLTAYLLVIGILLAATLLLNPVVTVLSESAPLPRRSRIVIDPGHGGEDGGAISCTGLPESQYNLEIALRLNDLLQLLGYETIMIRTTDTAIYPRGETLAQKKINDLKERVRIVNETEDGILVSIHQNSFPEGRYSGAQVFYSATEGSRELAEKLQTAFVTALNPGSTRKCKAAEGIYLMEHIYCPAILVECGFLTNPQEEAYLRSPDFQKKLCCVIASTLSQYLSNT